MSKYINPVPGSLTKKKLVVCLHGLNNNPSQFKNILDEVQQHTRYVADEFDLYIPRIINKGQAKLDTMVQPIFEEIKNWAKTDGEKELVLVGISNGGRIARAIEAELLDSPDTVNIKKMRFVSIVGACKGSKLVNLANSLGCSWLCGKLDLGWPLSKAISEEMPSGSNRNKQLDQALEGRVAGFKRSYTCLGSPHDCIVHKESTLPEVGNHPKRYAYIPGHGHNSIVAVSKVAKAVAEIIINEDFRTI